MADKALLAVDDALARILSGANPLPGAEDLHIAQALGRTLAEDVIAKRTQPPIDVSAMDGYAVRSGDLAGPGARVTLVGESAAGHGYVDAVRPGECVRIFTGAPVPLGADAVLLQEDAVVDGDSVGAKAPPGEHIRRKGLDFTDGHVALRKGARLGPAELALVAATNNAQVRVARRPRVAIIASGDELVPPGAEPGPAQIVSCNNLAVAGLVAAAGGEPVDLGIFHDDLVDLERALVLARDVEADVVVTLGGASVGDRDLLRPALERQGMTLDFWRIAMRPGKPLIFGRLGEAHVLGLPGNPVASFVCALVFLQPLLRALQGDPRAGADRSEFALLGVDMPANRGRRDYLRATLSKNADGGLVATPQPLQDSSLLTELVASDALLLRELGAGAGKEGERCQILRLRVDMHP
jgi:molybdopterin molybdotransferase